MSSSRDSSAMDWALVGRYLGGELSPSERVAFERWIEAEPGRREEIVLMRRLWDEAGAVPTASAVDGMWRSLVETMRSTEFRASDRLRAPVALRSVAPRRLALLSRSTWSGRWKQPALLAAAAVILFAAMLPDQPRALPAPLPKVFRTAPGQRATIQLSDGSQVELGVASVLTVAPFTDSSRNVTLDGEAVFEVVHDERRPFRVISAGTITEDLGTRFGVRAYPEDKRVRVFVTSGVVAVRSVATDASPSVLRAGELARLDRRGVVTLEANVDTARYLAWTTSRVVLRSEPLRDAVIELGRWHDAEIVIQDERVARMKITVDMKLGSLEESLNAVTVPLGLRYQLSDHGAVILR